MHIKLKKWEFMREELMCLGLDVGYDWWKAFASKMQSPRDMQIPDDSKKGLQDLRSLLGRAICPGAVYRILHIHQPP